jgi:hypothetical protein
MFSSILFAETVNFSINLIGQPETYNLQIGLSTLLISICLFGYYGFKITKKIVENLN